MTGRIRGFVKIDYARADMLLELTLERSASHGYRSEMACADKKLVVVLEEKRPIAGVDHRTYVFWLDGVVLLVLLLGDRSFSHFKGREAAWAMGSACQNFARASCG